MRLMKLDTSGVRHWWSYTLVEPGNGGSRARGLSKLVRLRESLRPEETLRPESAERM